MDEKNTMRNMQKNVGSLEHGFGGSYLYLSEVRKKLHSEKEAAYRAAIKTLDSGLGVRFFVIIITTMLTTIAMLNLAYYERGYFALGGELFVICLAPALANWLVWRIQKKIILRDAIK